MVYSCCAVNVGSVKQHEETCLYAVVACPNSNSETCGLHRRKSLQKHVDSCQHVPCPHHDKGRISNLLFFFVILCLFHNSGGSCIV